MYGIETFLPHPCTYTRYDGPRRSTGTGLALQNYILLFWRFFNCHKTWNTLELFGCHLIKWSTNSHEISRHPEHAAYEMSNIRPGVIKPEQPDFANPTHIVIGETMWPHLEVDPFDSRMKKRQWKLQTICFINSDKIHLIKIPTFVL